MARTSDFHSENVGSSPANPKMIKKRFLLPQHIQSLEEEFPKISFNFLFVSLFSPYIIDNCKTFFSSLNVTKKKIVLKESYMILS